MNLKISCVQTNSQNNIDDNIKSIMPLLESAVEEKADLIAMPENVVMMAASSEELLQNTYFEDENRSLKIFKEFAAHHKKWLSVGSLATKIKGQEKIANRSFLINDKGEIAASYDKIHLYDASVAGGETHRESDRYIAGDKAVLADSPWGGLGMTICYDLRFPYLYRHLALAGANIIFVPSAFTKKTGQAHWHVLLRARAIETGCFIVAAAQTGDHPKGRKTFGHSLIISPWGEVLADAGSDTGIITAEINLSLAEEFRQQIPSLYNGVKL